MYSFSMRGARSRKTHHFLGIHGVTLPQLIDSLSQTIQKQVCSRTHYCGWPPTSTFFGTITATISATKGLPERQRIRGDCQQEPSTVSASASARSDCSLKTLESTRDALDTAPLWFCVD